ncbi:MAG TPA: class D sortase [Bryobacteraceae bacterium]|nr:class D sortase [Bryobacteraceae bacterium]
MQKKLLVYLGCVLIVGGAVALGWYGYLRLDMMRAQREANQLLDDQKKHNSELLKTRPVPHAVVIVPPRAGEPIGRIEIPRLHISVMVLEGTAPKILRVAAGHIEGTALPGTGGNVGIAAHRDSFFRPLSEVRPEDGILLTTSYGTFRYVADAVEIVDPTDVHVLDPTADPELTLVTCYPFNYVGSAPKRFIVHAREQSDGAAPLRETVGLVRK